MVQLQEKLTNNIWIKADWETYLQEIEFPENEKCHGYYYNEEMGVSEYWVVDVQNCQIYAFQMLDRGSKRIDISLALPQLSIDTIIEALNRSKEFDQTQIGQWLMTEFKV